MTNLKAFILCVALNVEVVFFAFIVFMFIEKHIAYFYEFTKFAFYMTILECVFIFIIIPFVKKTHERFILNK